MTSGFRIALASTLGAVLLAGCYPYRLDGADVVPTDSRLSAFGYRMAPLQSMDALGARHGLQVTEEVLDATSGPVALTRFEHGDPRPLIVFCGGNMFRRGSGAQAVLERLAPWGDVWVFDYPGYGDTAGEGMPDEFQAVGRAITARVERAFADGRDGKLVFWGFSLGGLVCGDLAGRTAVSSDVVLLGTFLSFDQVVRAGAAAKVGPLARLVQPVIGSDVPAYDIARSLKGYDGKAVVVASRMDAVVPWLASARLEMALRDQGVATVMIDLPSGDHSGIHEIPGVIARIGEAVGLSPLE